MGGSAGVYHHRKEEQAHLTDGHYCGFDGAETFRFHGDPVLVVVGLLLTVRNCGDRIFRSSRIEPSAASADQKAPVSGSFGPPSNMLDPGP